MGNARGNWKMYLYTATTDTGALTPYSTIPVSTLLAAPYSATALALTSPTRDYINIVQSGKGYDNKTFSIEDVSGNTFGAMFATMIFRVECYPFSFAASSTDQDLDDMDVLRNFLNGKRNVWVRFDAGSRQQPSATAAYPVLIMEAEDSINKAGGTHGLTLLLRHKYRMGSY